jgi:hypothetical protein
LAGLPSVLSRDRASLVTTIDSVLIGGKVILFYHPHPDFLPSREKEY